jgi:hypothetical protein
VEDSDNKYKVDHRLEKSVEFTNMIPFLRSDADKKIMQIKKKNKRSTSG